MHYPAGPCGCFAADPHRGSSGCASSRSFWDSRFSDCSGEASGSVSGPVSCATLRVAFFQGMRACPARRSLRHFAQQNPLSKSGQLRELEYGVHRSPIPVVFQIGRVLAVFQNSRTQCRQALAAGLAYRRVENALRTFRPEPAANALAIAVFVWIDEAGLAVRGPAQIGHFTIHRHAVEPHLEARGRLLRGAHEHAGVVAGFGEGGGTCHGHNRTPRSCRRRSGCPRGSGE